MDKDVKQLQIKALKAIKQTSSLDQLNKIKISLLGRKGEISRLMKKIPGLPQEKRAKFGQTVNKLKSILEKEIKKHQSSIINHKSSRVDWLDVTIPGKRPKLGHIHPVTQIIWELTDIFEQMGYEIIEGPEVETDYYNFEALNIPKYHPARDLQDTFWLTNNLLPRTHTSAMQVRVMENRKPPFQIAVPGWVFRSEREDATHAAAFYQYEAFMVGKNISFSNLKGTLYEILQKILKQKTKLKFRASYFPYVEPCAEVSSSCPYCKTKGCKACGGSGWLELLGAGMIHPIVLKNSKINPDIYSGFAFSFGPERLAMIKYAIDDIRLFTGADLRFIGQF